ncbi:MAG: helix-turn-helix domain-containing protein [Cardiobacteriaceae bacterium]|nr:helix-turn-helix domain-containing protein [Cardiobacteriaceae bacterium]
MPDKSPIRRAVDQSLADYYRHLGEEGTAADVYRMIVNDAEAAVIANIMTRCKGNQSKAAVVLGISRNTLKKKLVEYRLLENES